MNMLALLASYPLGDDTPILLYAVIGVVAVALIVVSILMGKKSKDDKENKK